MELNGKKVYDIELNGIHKWDSPDYSDAYVSSACWASGEALTQDELDELNNHNGAEIHALIFDRLPL